VVWTIKKGSKPRQTASSATSSAALPPPLPRNDGNLLGSGGRGARKELWKEQSTHNSGSYFAGEIAKARTPRTEIIKLALRLHEAKTGRVDAQGRQVETTLVNNLVETPYRLGS